MDKTYTKKFLIINILKVHIIYRTEMMWTIFTIKKIIIPALRIFFRFVSHILQETLSDIPDG